MQGYVEARGGNTTKENVILDGGGKKEKGKWIDGFWSR